MTLNAGMRMTAWFDIIDLGPNAKQDEEGLKQSSQICKRWNRIYIEKVNFFKFFLSFN